MNARHQPPRRYLHGYSKTEQARLRRTAAFAEHTIFQDVNFSTVDYLLEVGSGVGAQSEILLRRFPKLKLTCVELNPEQIQAAEESLGKVDYFKGRYSIQKMDATEMAFEGKSFDGAFLCWILEHVPDPGRVLNEVRRVLRPASWVVVNEVMNSSFFLDPYSPNLWKYWMAFNDYQYDHAGDPFIGAKLGNLLISHGYLNIQTQVKTWHFDNREPEKRKESISIWAELLLSGSERLLEAKYVTKELVKKMEDELNGVKNNPDAVFYYSFIQAKAQVF